MLSVKTHLLTWSAVACCALAFAGGTAIIATAQVPATPASDPFAAPKPAEKPAAEPEKPGEFKLSDAPPVVVKTVPEAGADGVDPELKELRVTFSKKMTDKSWSWATDKRFGEEIEGEKPAYEKDRKTIVRAVTLKPNTTYAVWLNTEKFGNFKDAEGTSAVPYLLVFRTGKGK